MFRCFRFCVCIVKEPRICTVKFGVKMEEFYGKKYKQVKTEHFDEMLKFLDINFLHRQIAHTQSPVQFVTSNDDGTYSIHYKSLVANFEVLFTPGVEFVEAKPGGVKVRALITIEGNTISHRQVEDNGRTLNHVYEFLPDKMIITSTGPGLDYVVKRHYVPVK